MCWLLRVARSPRRERNTHPRDTQVVPQRDVWPFAIVDRSISGPGSVLMIVGDRDEAEVIANEIRRGHFDIGIIEVKTEPQDRSGSAR